VSLMNKRELRQLALSKNEKLENIWFEQRDSLRIRDMIDDAYAEFTYALTSKARVDAPGIAVLGKSGSGKTNSVVRALQNIGLYESEVGDTERPLLVCELGANATLRGLSQEVLNCFGWPAANGSAQYLWHKASDYFQQLNTRVLILDEIQHVRATGSKDQKDLQAFLKSIVQPGGPRFMPILVGMPEFEEVLNSDTQLDRRYTKIKMRSLEPVADLAIGMQILERYCNELQLPMHSSVASEDFAARLMHAGLYSFGSVSVWCRRGIFQAVATGATELAIEHFQEAYRSREDCVPALNPFIALDYQNIKENQISD